MSCFCCHSLPLPHGAMVWSVVCDCCIFWPYSLTFYCMIRQNSKEYMFLHSTQLFENRQTEELTYLANHLLHSTATIGRLLYSIAMVFRWWADYDTWQSASNCPKLYYLRCVLCFSCPYLSLPHGAVGWFVYMYID